MSVVVGEIIGKLKLDTKSFNASLKKSMKDATNFKKEIAKSVKTPSINVNVKQALASIKQVSNALAKLPSNKKITITTSQSVSSATSRATRVPRNRSGESAVSRRAPFNIDRNLVDISTKPLLKFLAGGELIQAFKQIGREAIKGSDVLSKSFDKLFQSSVSIFRSFGELLLKTPIIGDAFKAFSTGLSNVAKFLDDWNRQGLVQATTKSPGTAIGVGAGAITLAALLGPLLAENFEKIKTAITLFIAGIKKSVDARFTAAFTKGSFVLFDAKDFGFLDKLLMPISLALKNIVLSMGIWAAILTGALVTANLINSYYNEFAKLDDGEESRGLIAGIFDGIKQVFTWVGDFFSWVGTLDFGFATLGEILQPIGDFFVGLGKGIAFIADSVMEAAKVINDKMAEGWFKLLFGDAFKDLEASTQTASMTEVNRKRKFDAQQEIQQNKEAINRERSRLTAQFSKTTPEGIKRLQDEAISNLFVNASSMEELQKFDGKKDEKTGKINEAIKREFKNPIDKIFAELALSISGGELLLRATVSEFDKNIIDSIRSGNKELSAESLKSLSTDAARLEAIKAFEGGGIDMESILKTFTNGLLRFNAEQIIKKKNLSPEDQFNRGITIAEQEQMERDKKIPTIRSIAKDIGLEEALRRAAMSNVARKLGLAINPASQINPALAPKAQFGSVEAFKIINERTSTEDKIQRNTERTASVLEKLLSNGLTLKDIAVAN